MMTVYGYCRVSSADQEANGSSLASQEAAVSAIGAAVENIFTDGGVSGSVPLAERPQGGLMMSRLQSGDTIIATKLDRLFRSALDAMGTVESLKAGGVKVVLTDMGPTPVTENGVAKMFFQMLAVVAEFERGRIKERTTEGRAAKKAAGGHYAGKAPFGWRIVGTKKESRIEADAEQQSTITRMRAMHAGGASLRAIEAALKAEGVQLSRTSIARALRA